jgi:DNA-binding transcriptional regulator YiaG
MPTRSDVEVLLQGSATNLQVWFEQKNLLPADNAAAAFLKQQNWVSAVQLARASEPLIHYCVNIITDLVPGDKDAINELIHLELAPVWMSGWLGARSSPEADVAVGLIARIRRWLHDLKPSERLHRSVEINNIEPPRATAGFQIRASALSYLTLASLDVHATETRNDAYRLKLNWIRSALGISPAELARLLHVSREAIRRWELGESISSERWADIDELHSYVEKLLTYIRPERLPAVIRRRIPALSNQAPLELIASRRVGELIALYESLTSYETTA